MNADDADTFLRMHKAQESPNRAELVSIVASVDSPLTNNLLSSAIEGATAAELLALPRPLLLANLDKIWKSETLYALLRSLPDSEATILLNRCWNKISWDDGRGLIQNNFPFSRAIALSNNMTQLQKIASIPAGFTFARM